ncbi:uncharacterized protein MEPE_04607 [Melanopsichium pennsylvanicum]|uniref:Uncharacterized protein n=2 Tax=Melanopsichium pennsylvanicum TaxID=63383 RepID=A0AAJ4XRS8_9BASI|nr:putative protein [Melanopsichium pennsylvanicum 4]SNX85898.1 uncharacterized protein MEPE_04607 [Melanopsichium pennsylvanicum]
MLTTTSTAPVLQHTNEFNVPHAIRSASSPSASFATVNRARATSLDLDPGSQNHSLSISPSFPSQLYPRSSILINSRKRPYSGVIFANPVVVAGSSTAAAPVVTHIPAVPSRKEREKERERAREQEKERERERAKAKSKDDEKIWGIPKKALLLGLGDLNFNAQMAMMAGWGHGSGGVSILPSTVVPTNERKRIRPSSSAELQRSTASSISSRRSVKDSDNEDEGTNKERQRDSSSSLRCSRSNASIASSDGGHTASNKKSASQADGSSVSPSPTDEPMDPEELAALNAIINTRRSMAAAQALVSGTISITAPRILRGSSYGSSSQDLTRPQLEEKRFESQDSVPSMSSVAHSAASLSSSNLPISPYEKTLQPSALVASNTGSTILEAADVKSPRIRFAPLPTPTSAPPMLGGGGGVNGSALIEDSDELDATDSGFDSEDDSKSMKGKWYLMGMPSALFKPQYYTNKNNRRRHSRGNSISGHSVGDADDRSEDGNSFRRKSTGSLSDGFGTDVGRRAPSENDEEERGRAEASGSKSRRKPTHARRRSRSRTGAMSSGDEDERARKRELIRLARPGGTGMVTLPDGTKIRARRVNDLPTQEEPEFIEWGFAGLAREASRRSLGGSGPPSLATTPNHSEHKGLAVYMEGEEDEEDDGSGMAWVRRRRREREAKARLERDQAAADAAEAAKNPASAPASIVPDAHDSSTVEGDASITADATTTKVVAVPSTAVASLPTDPAIEAGADEPMPLICDEAVEPNTIAVAVTSRRQSHLSAIDTSRPPHDVFGEANTFVSSPTEEEPPAGLEASMLSEIRQGDSAMGGSRILARSARGSASEQVAAPGDSTPRQNTGLGLTAVKAEEIRRRHEDEVAALGAEVLAQTRRNNQRRQASSSGRGVASPHLGEDSAGEQQHASPTTKSSHRVSQASVASPPTLASSSMLVKSTSRDSGYEKKSISRTVGSIMRKATNDSDKTMRYSGLGALTPSHEDGDRKKQEVSFSQTQGSAERKQHEVFAATVVGGGPQLAPNAHVAQTSNLVSARSASPESTLSLKSSAVGGYSASSASKSVSSLHGASGSLAPSPMSTKRIPLDPSVSTPAPSPWLPRRPDARGVSVVPLPQLGVRPERPREGRVWQYDDSDASDAGKDAASDHEEEEEEEGSDLDAEELEEEERKTAMQKKRATTRAAGQEVVHARLGNKASGRALSDLTASYDDMALGSSLRQQKQQRSGRDAYRRSSIDPRVPGNSSRSPTAPRKAPPRLIKSHRSTQSMKSAEGDDDEDETDLWPAASATSRSGTTRPRHILVNLPGGPGIWDSKKGGGRNAVAAINSVAAARAKAIKKRAKDRRTSFELPPGWDDEMMDYGWPRSLKGSLY